MKLFCDVTLAYYVAKLVRQAEAERAETPPKTMLQKGPIKKLCSKLACALLAEALKGGRCKGLQMVQSEDPWH